MTPALVVAGAALLFLLGVGVAAVILARSGGSESAPSGPAPSLAPIGQVKAGERVRVRGRVVVLERQTSPYQRRPCAAWRLKIERMRHDLLETLLDETSPTVFGVEDDTGRVLVSLKGASPAIEVLDVGRCSRVVPPDASQRAVLDLFGLRRELDLSGDARFAEGVVREGAWLQVAGLAELRDGQLHLVAPPGGRLGWGEGFPG